MLFGWEFVMTFVLVSVVYAVAVGEPSFGNVGPYAVGLSLFAMVFAGKLYPATPLRMLYDMLNSNHDGCCLQNKNMRTT